MMLKYSFILADGFASLAQIWTSVQAFASSRETAPAILLYRVLARGHQDFWRIVLAPRSRSQ